MKIVYDNGERSINRIPMAYACCDKCEKPIRFAIGFVNEPLVNPWDEEEHKYCEKCGAFMDCKTVNIESQYKIFFADHNKQVRAEVIDECNKKLDELERKYKSCYGAEIIEMYADVYEKFRAWLKEQNK